MLSIQSIEYGSLWVPHRLAAAMVEQGLGSQAADYLKRAYTVPKAATSAPENRPTALMHYDSLVVQGALSKTSEIVMVDDVVTRGATFLGAANRLAEAFPNALIRGFAAMRAISPGGIFKSTHDPVLGSVKLTPKGAFRQP